MLCFLVPEDVIIRPFDQGIVCSIKSKYSSSSTVCLLPTDKPGANTNDLVNKSEKKNPIEQRLANSDLGGLALPTTRFGHSCVTGTQPCPSLSFWSVATFDVQSQSWPHNPRSHHCEPCGPIQKMFAKALTYMWLKCATC